MVETQVTKQWRRSFRLIGSLLLLLLLSSRRTSAGAEPSVRILIPVCSDAGEVRISAGQAVRKKDGFHLTYTVPGTYRYTVTNPSFPDTLFHVQVCVVSESDGRLEGTVVIERGNTKEKVECIRFGGKKKTDSLSGRRGVSGGIRSGGGGIRTGDRSDAVLWLGAFLLSALCAVRMLLFKKRGEKV